jgi:hypothetical protein
LDITGTRNDTIAPPIAQTSSMWLPCRDDTIKIKVQVEGRSLPVYQVKHFSDAEPLRSEGWICSEEGKVCISTMLACL